ncbi:MAG: helix-turn-helix domain-containing protein [Colwellia sp.]|nr:helix-turn-helix domain-containing protein [Colwellia sp.]
MSKLKAISPIEIPDSTFYGEIQRSSTLELLHCESLVERSRQHNWKINPHRHSGITQLFYVQEGEAKAHLDGNMLLLSPPCILIVPEGCVHDFSWSECTQGHVLSVASTLLNRIIQPLSDSNNILRKTVVHKVEANQRQLVNSLFTSISQDYQQHGVQDLMLETLLTALTIYLNRQTISPVNNVKRQERYRVHFSAFLQLVEKQYTNQWTIAKYAKQLSITPPHINSICKKMSNQSALEIVHQRLLLEAKRNLIYTGRTITEISYILNFSDPSHFTRFFKNKTGKNPKAFRSA